MAQIKIEISNKSHTAVITKNKSCDESSWIAIRTFFEDRFPLLVENLSKTIILPWWAFIGSRDDLKYVLEINEIIDIEFGNLAEKLLVTAQKKEGIYQLAQKENLKIPENEIKKTLKQIGFERLLLPYQLRNVTKLCALPSAATFSVPGAGKTTEALAYYFFTKKKNDKLLVIAPKNAFVAWEEELPACVPNTKIKFVRLTGGKEKIKKLIDKNPDAVIISYHQLPRVLKEISGYLVSNSVYMFVDESHRMKRGMMGLHGSAILSISHLPKQKLILSGTPVPNKTEDLIPQINFLYPEIVVSLNNISDSFKNIFVRTTKGELGLKPPRRTIVDVPMGTNQQKLYLALSSDATRRLEGLNVNDRMKFRKFSQCVQYMLQAASNPSLLINSNLANHSLVNETIKEGMSKKIEYACSVTRKLVREGNKVLLWSNFVNTVEHVAELLSDVGAEYIHGSVVNSDDPDIHDSRENKIKLFNDAKSNCKVLVANPAACSEGISLHHVCHHAIYIDRNYNAAQYLQSEDRIHRIGLKKDISTEIILLRSPGTIDESVNRRLLAKVNNMKRILDDPDLSIEPLDLDLQDDEFNLDEGDINDLKKLLKVN